MSYSIDLGQWNTVFAVPASVVDQHLKLATEAQLKVLLYLLRHSGDPASDEQITKATGSSQEEVANAVDFWINRGLLVSTDDALTPSQNNDTSSAIRTTVKETPQEEESQKHTAISRAVKPDTAYVVKQLNSDKNLAGLMEEAQSVMQKPLSPGDTATLVMLYDTFGLPCDVLAMLLHYAASIGSANMRTVERIGIRWSDTGIYSVEEAEREIERLAHSHESWGRVSSLLGIRMTGRPTQAQLENADRWLNDWGFNDEMILEAYERCVNSKGEYNMRYINAILKSWYKKRIFSLDALKESETKAPAKKAQKKSSKGSVFSTDGASFDLEQYEKQSLFDD